MTERVRRANEMAENDRFMQSVEYMHAASRWPLAWRHWELRAWLSYVKHGSPVIGLGGLS